MVSLLSTCSQQFAIALDSALSEQYKSDCKIFETAMKMKNPSKEEVQDVMISLDDIPFGLKLKLQSLINICSVKNAVPNDDLFEILIRALTWSCNEEMSMEIHHTMMEILGKIW